MDTTGTIAAVGALSLGAVGSLQYAFGKRSSDKSLESVEDVLSTLIALVVQQDMRIRQLENNVVGGQAPPNHGNGQVVTRLSVLEGQVNNLVVTVGSMGEDVDYLLSEKEQEVQKIEKPLPARRTSVAQPPQPAKRVAAPSAARRGGTASSSQPVRESRTNNTARVPRGRSRVVTPAPSDDDGSIYGDDVDDSELLNAVSGR